MNAQSFFEQNGGTYMQVGDYYIPDLKEAHRPILFSELTLSGKLYQHLAETDHACKERVELIIWQMKGREGVTEALKAVDQIEWIRRMNSIYNRAEEIVLNELVYC